MNYFPDFDSDSFAMGEKIAAMLASMGVSSLEVDGQTLVHAARLESPTEPLSGCGDDVRPGDLVEVWWDASRPTREYAAAIVNHYDPSTGDLSLVTQRPEGYAVSLMSAWGAWGRRRFGLLEKAPEVYLPHTNASLQEDPVVASLDERFALHGSARPPSLVDSPVVMAGTGSLHAALQGQTRSACGRQLPAPATGSLFDRITPGVCGHCVRKEASLAGRQGSFADRPVRQALCVEVYGLRL